MSTLRWATVTATLVGGLYWGASSWFSREPEVFDITVATTAGDPAPQVIGVTTTNTLIQIISTLLDKSGGLLSNDVTPPFVGLDNMPAWELGVLEMSRDLVLAMRSDFSRSQSQSIENKFLQQVSPHLNMDHRRWAMPAAEDEYKKAALLRSQIS